MCNFPYGETAIIWNFTFGSIIVLRQVIWKAKERWKTARTLDIAHRLDRISIKSEIYNYNI